MSRSLRNTAAFSLLLLAVLIYRLAVLEAYFDWSTSTSQFALLPVVFLAVSLLSVGKQVVPRFAIVMAMLASVFLGVAGFGIRPEQSSEVKVYLSPFLSDSHESQTIKFADLLQKNFINSDLNLEIERIPNPVTSVIKINEFFKSKLSSTKDETALLLSGTPRWLALSVSPQFAAYLVSPSLSRITSAFNLNVTTELAGTGLSEGFSAATLNYITRVFAALSALSFGDVRKAEIELVDAASIVGRWSGTSHRSYALWLLGTLYLNKTFSADSFESAYLYCAIDYLSRARGFVRKNESPELLSAIINNRAVAHFLGYVFLGNRDMRKLALREFKTASRLTSKGALAGDNPAWAIAKANLYYLNRGKGLKKQFLRKVRKQGKVKKKVSV